MDRLEQNVMRAEEADRILNSQLFSDAFDQVRESYLRAWEQLPTAETKDAQDLHRRLKCLADVKKILVRTIETGKLAQKELTAREKAAKLARNVVNTFANPFRSR